MIVHGGSNGLHVYDNLFSISFSFGRDFNRFLSAPKFCMTNTTMSSALRQLIFQMVHDVTALVIVRDLRGFSSIGAHCRIATSLAAMQPAHPSWPPQAQRTSHSSSTQSSGTTSSAGVTTSAADPETVRQQLASLLQRRSANDMQVLCSGPHVRRTT